MWITLKQYCDRYPWPANTMSLRVELWGIEKAMGKTPSFVHRYGKRVLIDGELFQAWITTKEATEVKRRSLQLWRESRNKKIADKANK